jgi:O-antigen/teichoic acid export membrane protein
MVELGFRGILKSASVVGAGMIFSKAISLLAETIIARQLTAGKFGAAIFAYTALLTLSSIALIGIPQGFTYYLSIFDERGDDDAAFRTVLSGLSILFVILGISVLGIHLIPFSIVSDLGISRSQWRWIRLLSPLTVAYPLTRVSFGIMRGYDKSVPKVLSDDVLNKIFALIGLGTAIWLNTIEYVFLSFYLGQYILSGLFAGGYVLHLLRIKMRQITLRSNFYREAQQLVSYSWPLALKNATRRILGSTDILLVGALAASSSAVGYYRIGFVISQLGMIPLLSILYLYTPRFSRNHDNSNRKEMEDLYRQAAKWSTILSLPLLTPMLYYSNYIIRTLFGGEYTPGAVVLVILSIDVIFRSGMGTAAPTLQAIGRTKVDFVTTGATTVINLGLSYLLILEFGIMGAAIGTFVSIFAMNSMQLILVYWHTSLHPFSKKYLYFILTMIPSTLLLYTVVTSIFKGYQITPLQLPVGLPIFLIGFVILEISFVWFGGFISTEEKDLIREFIHRYRLREG